MGPGTGKKTILLVDDRDPAALEEEKSLRGLGYDVITARSGGEAVNTAAGGAAIDLVLLDIGLGGGTGGREAARLILEKRQLPILFLASPADRDAAERLRGIAHYGCVMKDSGDWALRLAIETALELYNARVKAEQESARRERAEHEARERTKEIQALYFLSEITERKGITLEKIYRELADTLPLSWQYPEAACARIVIDNREYHTPNYAESQWKQSAPIMVHGFLAGTLEISYLEEKPPEDEGPFLKEERLLIRAIAERLGHIIERMRSEEEITNTLFFQQALMDAIPAPIFHKDARLVYTGGNKAFERFIGLSREQFTGKTVFEISPPDLAEIYDRADRQLLASPGSQTYETLVVFADGTRHNVVFSKATFNRSDGTLAGIIGVILDITERKQAEKALLESEARFRVISANTSDIAYSCRTDEDGSFSIDWITGASGRITGYSDDEIRSQGCWRFLVIDEDIGLFEKNVTGLAPGSKGSCELRIRHRNGSIVWILSSAECQTDPDNPGRHRLYGGLTEITDRKRAGEKIQTLLREKELLLREVHHRIKNNMSAMMAILTLQADTLKEPASVRALKEARSRMQSMSVLYDRLYSSDNVNEMSFANYISGLLGEIVPLFPNSSSVRINSHIDDFTLDVKTLSSLGIIVNELITNAMKYAFPGRSGGTITVSASKRENRATVIIEDNGVGIPEIFDINTAASFGLKLVSILVRQINGSITVERENGTRIAIEFEA